MRTSQWLTLVRGQYMKVNEGDRDVPEVGHKVGAEDLSEAVGADGSDDNCEPDGNPSVRAHDLAVLAR